MANLTEYSSRLGRIIRVEDAKDTYAICFETCQLLFWYDGKDADTVRVKEEVSIRNGERHGLCRSYYINGTRHQFRFYKKGILHGISQTWDQNGTCCIEDIYQDGSLICSRVINL